MEVSSHQSDKQLADRQLQLAAQLAAENNTLRIEVQRLREELRIASSGPDTVVLRSQQRSYEELLAAKNEALEKKLESLNRWAEETAEKLKRSQVGRKQSEEENASLRARLDIATEKGEALQSHVARLEHGASPGAAESPLGKRVAQLERQLKEARESLKRKRDREVALLKVKDSLEAHSASLVREVSRLKEDNVELSDKLAMALEGITLCDGLTATVARPFSDNGMAFERRDVVTVLAAEGGFAKVVRQGASGRVPIANLACVGIPLLQYIELVMPERSEREHMLEKWLQDAGLLSKEPVVPTRRVGAVPEMANGDSVVQIRRKFENLLNELDASFSECESPMSISALTTPRQNVNDSKRDAMLEKLMSTVSEISVSANVYTAGFDELNKEAVPLMRAMSSEMLIQSEELKKKVSSLELSNKQAADEIVKLQQEREQLQQQQQQRPQESIFAITPDMPDVESLERGELSFASLSNLEDQAHSAETLQLQIDLNDSVVEREQQAMELDSLRAQFMLMRGADDMIARERERCVLLERRIVELSGVEERCAELSRTSETHSRKISDLEQANATLAAQLSKEKERAAQMAETMHSRIVLSNSTESSTPPASNSPAMQSKRSVPNIFSKLNPKRSGSKKVLLSAGSVQDANAAALLEARADLEAAERKLAKSPRAGSAKATDLLAERDRLVAEVRALEAVSREASAPPVSDPESDAALAKLNARGSVRGSLHDSVIADDELNAILAGVLLSPEETAERFRNDDTRGEELQRRSFVLKHIPGVKVVEKSTDGDAMKEKLALAEKKIADLTMQLEAESRRSAEGEDARKKVDELTAKLEKREKAVVVVNSGEERLAELSAQVQKLEKELEVAHRAYAVTLQSEKEKLRDESEKLRRAEFDRDELRTLLAVEKETIARIQEREEASKMSMRAEVAGLKHAEAVARQENERLTENVAQLDRRLVDAMRDMDGLTQTVAATQSMLSTSESTIVEMEKRLVEATKVIEQLHAAARDTKLSSQLEGRIVEATLLIEHLTAEKKRLDGEAISREKRIEEAARVTDQLTAANKALSAQNKELLVQQETLQQRLVDATVRISQLREDHEAAERSLYAQKQDTQNSDTVERRLVEATILISQLREASDASVAREAEAAKKTEAQAREMTALQGRLAEATGIIESLFAANKKLEEQKTEGSSLEGRLVEAAKTISQLRDQNKTVMGETEEMRVRYNKLSMTLRDLTGRYNASMSELKNATAVIDVMKKELENQAKRYDALDRQKNPTPMRPGSRAAVSEDLEMAAQMQALAKMINAESAPTTPVRGNMSVKNDGSQEARVLSKLVDSTPPDDNDATRRLASLDVREARIEARETLLARLNETRAGLKKAEESLLAESRARRDVETQLATVKQQLSAKERERTALLGRCRELEESLDKQQDEAELSLTSLNHQIGQLQTERAELRKALDSRLQTQPDFQQVVAAEMRCALLAQEMQQNAESHAQNAKYLSEELASQKRLRGTYEEVNTTLKATAERLQGEVEQMRDVVSEERAKCEALRKERDAIREELEMVTIDRNMYERITIKLQLRIGDDEASDDEGRSNVELKLREEISALKEQLAHENLRKHQLFESLESLRKERHS